MSGDAEDTIAATMPPTQAALEATVPSAGSPAAPKPSLVRGDVVGRYVVLNELGAGGMGVVYAAYDPELDRKIALKLLRPDPGGGSSGAAATRLLREAQALAKLSHPNVVAVHDVGTVEGQVWIAMEFIEGRTLGAWAKGRGWRPVLVAVQAAGRGLAAAHAAGLLHRDFKPDNVMVGDDGRVRVMDFGLARTRDGADSNLLSTQAEEATEAAPELAVLNAPLTQAGAILGTPGYLAPEQFAGQTITPAADQFALCVTCWEVLFGERPFAGRTLMELAANVLAGKTRAPPADRRVPGWVRAACARGLDVDPTKRWPSVEAFIAELERGQGRTRLRRVFGGLAVVAVGGAGMVGYYQYELSERVAACTVESDAIDEVWNAETREALSSGLVSTGVSYAVAAAEKVPPWIDQKAEAWRSAAKDACMASAVEERWTAAKFEKARWCLEERKLELSSYVTRMAGANPALAREAVRVAVGLDPAEACIDERALAVMSDPPPADLRPEISAIWEMVTEARYLGQSGAYEEGLELAREAKSRATTLAWPPLLAKAEKVEGYALERMGVYDDAEAAYVRSYVEAGRADRWSDAAIVAARLVNLVGFRQRRPHEGKTWGELASLAISQAGDPGGLLEAQRLNALGLLHNELGDYAHAIALHEESLALHQAASGADNPEVAVVLVNLASSHRALGKYDEATATLHRALELMESSLGENHPNVASTFNNLASVHLELEQYAEAKQMYMRALAIWEETLGPEHPKLAIALGNLGLVHLRLGEHERARTLFARALALDEKALGPDNPNVGYSLQGLGAALGGLGRYSEAIPYLERALRVRSEGRVAFDELARTEWDLCELLWDAPIEQGQDRERALELARQARERLTGASGSGADALAEIEAWLEEHGP